MAAPLEFTIKIEEDAPQPAFATGGGLDAAAVQLAAAREARIHELEIEKARLQTVGYVDEKGNVVDWDSGAIQRTERAIGAIKAAQQADIAGPPEPQADDASRRALEDAQLAALQQRQALEANAAAGPPAVDPALATSPRPGVADDAQLAEARKEQAAAALLVRPAVGLLAGDMTNLECPACGKLLTVKAVHAGQLMKCPACGEKFVVPGADELARAAALETARPALAAPSDAWPFPVELASGAGTMAFADALAPRPAPPEPVPPPFEMVGPPEPPPAFVGPPEPTGLDAGVLRERRERERLQQHERDINEARARLDPDALPEALPVKPTRKETPVDAISPRDLAARRQEADAFNKQVEAERREMDPDYARQQDQKALGQVGRQLNIPGAPALQHIGEASKLPEALAGIGEEGGLAAAAGPIGAAIAIADEAAKALAGGMDIVRKEFELFGQVAGDTVRNDYMGAFNHTVDAAADGLRKIPIVGQVVASELELTVAPLRMFNSLVNDFVDRGKQLAQYSPEISMARAQVEIRGIMADLQEAQTLGPGMARLTDVQDQLWQELREIMLPIKEFLLDTLVAYLEELRDWMPAIRGGTKRIVDILVAIISTITPFTTNAEALLRAIARGLEEKEKTEFDIDSDRMIREILGERAGDDPRFLPTDLLDAERGLGIPAIPGGF